MNLQEPRIIDPVEVQVRSLMDDLKLQSIEVPPCYNNVLEYLQWMKASIASATSKTARQIEDYCVDCLPAYKAKMVLENRCSHLETRFYTDSEGAICGTRYVTTQKHLIEDWREDIKREVLA